MRAESERRRERLDTLAIILLVLLCTAYTFPRWADWNQNSRFDLTFAMVEEGSLTIDCCVENTGDYALFEGHTYTDKAPGLSFAAVPAYVLWKAIGAVGLDAAANRMASGAAVQGTLRPGGSGLRADKMRFATALTFATLVTVALPAALASGLMFHFLAAFSTQRGYRIAVTFAYALATSAFAYSNAFYAHQFVAALLFTAFVLLFTLTAGRLVAARLTAVGLLLGLALISEYPAVLIAGVLIGYALFRLHSETRVDLKQSAWLALGMLPPLLAAAAYHLAIFHTPWPVAYRYSALWQARHSVGFISISTPQLEALWGITFSPFRGLFFMSPVLLLSLWGGWYLWQQRAHRPALLVSAAAVTAFLAFNSASVMWWGGFAVGPRYLLPAIPFLAWPLVGFLARHGSTTWGRGLFTALALVSIAITWSLTLAGQQFPEDSHRFPLLEYSWPLLQQGNVARNAGTVLGFSGWASLALLALAVALVVTGWLRVTRR